MRQFIIATHGNMAEGMKSTIGIIIGEQENLTCVCAYTPQCPDPIPEFEKVMSEHPEDEIIIMTDILGGSVNNEAMKCMRDPRVHVVTGTNLAMAITLLTSPEDLGIEEVIAEAVDAAMESLVRCRLECAEDEDEF